MFELHPQSPTVEMVRSVAAAASEGGWIKVEIPKYKMKDNANEITTAGSFLKHKTVPNSLLYALSLNHGMKE